MGGACCLVLGLWGTMRGRQWTGAVGLSVLLLVVFIRKVPQGAWLSSGQAAPTLQSEVRLRVKFEARPIEFEFVLVWFWRWCNVTACEQRGKNDGGLDPPWAYKKELARRQARKATFTLVLLRKIHHTWFLMLGSSLGAAAETDWRRQRAERRTNADVVLQ